MIFGSMLVGVFALANWRLAENLEYPEELQYKELFAPQFQAEVVIFGTSRAAQGIDPALFPPELAAKTYNFAQLGSPPSNFRTWYHRFFKQHYPSTKTVILEVEWTAWADLPMRRRVEIDSEYWPLSTFWEQMKTPAGLSRTSMLYHRIPTSAHREDLQHLFYPKTDFAPFHKTDFSQGHIPYTLPPGSTSPPDTLDLQGDYAEILALRHWIAELQADGLEVILVHTPELVPGRYSSEYAQRLQAISEFAETNQIPFLNGLEDSRLTTMTHDSTYFGDWIHLNRKGSRIYSRQLGEDLTSIICEKSTKND